MRIVFILAGFFINGGVGTPEEDWACNFVGIRIHRTPSKCDSGLCVGLNEWNSWELLSCPEAAALASDIIAAIPHPAREVDEESLLKQLKPNVWNALGTLIFGGDLDVEKTRQLFLDIDGSIAKLFIENPAVVDSLKATSIVADLSIWAKEVLKQSNHVSYLADVYNRHTDLLHYHFVMDWMSWFGISTGLKQADFLSVTIGSFRKADRYREVALPREVRLVNNQQNLKLECMTELIDHIDDLALRVKVHRLGNSSPTYPSMNRLAHVVKHWNVGLEDATTDLLTTHIKYSGLCRNIAKLSDMTRKSWSLAWHKTMLTFMEICRSSINTADIVEAGMYLEQARPRRVAPETPISFDSVRKTVENMIANRKNCFPGWITGMETPVQQFEALRHYKSITNVIADDGTFRAGEQFQGDKFAFYDRLRTLGQGMGSVLISSRSQLFASSFGNTLGLRPDIASAIHTLPADASHRLISCVFYVRQGVREAMGGFGVGAFTLEQWELLFQRV